MRSSAVQLSSFSSTVCPEPQKSFFVWCGRKVLYWQAYACLCLKWESSVLASLYICQSLFDVGRFCTGKAVTSVFVWCGKILYWQAGDVSLWRGKVLYSQADDVSLCMTWGGSVLSSRWRQSLFDMGRFCTGKPMTSVFVWRGKVLYWQTDDASLWRGKVLYWQADVASLWRGKVLYWQADV